MDRQQLQPGHLRRASNTAADVDRNANLPLLLYVVHPLLLGPLPSWQREMHRIASLGFSGVLTAPVFAPGLDGNIFHTADHDRAHPLFMGSDPVALHSNHLLSRLVGMARQQGLDLYLDIVLDRVAASGVLAASNAAWMRHNHIGDAAARLHPSPREDVLRPHLDSHDAQAGYAAWWNERLSHWRAIGIRGFRCLGMEHVPPGLWQRITDAYSDCIFIAWTPGLSASFLTQLPNQFFTATCDSLAWWDFRAPWIFNEHDRLAQIAPPLAVPEAPFAHRLAAYATDTDTSERLVRRQIYTAATFGAGSGWLFPMGVEYGARRPLDPINDRPKDWTELAERRSFDLTADLQTANAIIKRHQAAIEDRSELRPLRGPGTSITAILRRPTVRHDQSASATLLMANADLHAEHSCHNSTILAAAGRFAPYHSLVPGNQMHLNPCGTITLAAGEAKIFSGSARNRPHHRHNEASFGQLLPVTNPASVAEAPSIACATRSDGRIAIESVSPSVEAGRFAAKRTLGDMVMVEADLICDGHETLSANLLWRPLDEKSWRFTKMRPIGNDRWQACFPAEHLARYIFCIEAWIDSFLTFRDELQKKRASGADLSLELEEGLQLLQSAATRGSERLKKFLHCIRNREGDARIALFMTEDLAAAMAAADHRPFLTRSGYYPVDCDPVEARFAAWYELFPRSQSELKQHHGTFDDVIAQLPRIQFMGFDVLYLTPIHPIGRQNRKGRNNSLVANQDDPGSPYAIGAPEGGHDAIHPKLGTLHDFHRLRDAAHKHGMMLALDFAIQCSPDHPWIQQHKEWFSWRPDGSIRHAENPPKKYEDIVNVDFYAAGAVPSLWLALRDVVRFWANQGVTLFRVDNPHTKPFSFWEWLIADIRRDTPECIFLSEAFTRPKRMHRLAKLGFSQSYTYFTWRNAKNEIQEYITELCATEVRNFFRPHFFVNTPDINPTFLQTSGRPGFLIRAVLAATLSGLWGIYSGFEICEASAVPGKEEYLNSEKYEIRNRSWENGDTIANEIAQINRIRKANPALQSHLGTTFHNAFNDQVIWYRRETADKSNTLLIAVSLDPFHTQEAMVELPLWEWGLPDNASLEAEDLMRDTQFVWHGKNQILKLDPSEFPFGIWRVRPVGTE